MALIKKLVQLKMKRYRGKELDQKIEEICKEYMNVNPAESRITRSLIVAKLELKSRSTIVGKRGEIIDYYAREQERKFQFERPTTKRKSLQQRIEKLKQENQALKEERDKAISTYMAILNGLNIRGINVDEIIEPLFDPHS